MWYVDVIKKGVGLVNSYWFSSRSEAVAKAKEIEASDSELGCMIQWEN